MKMKQIAAILVTALAMAHSASAELRVLAVLTSHDRMGDTGHETGFWLSELTHPYYVLTDAGFSVDIASIDGGMAPIDARSFESEDPLNERFLKDADLMAKVIRSVPLSKVDASDYHAVLYCGGHGTMWDFPGNKEVQRVTAEVYEHEGIVAAVCHGPAALVDVKLSDGSYLVNGKNVSAFTNEEEDLVQLTDAVPFLLQDKLIERGAKFKSAAPWQDQVVVDGRLITGQNPASAHTLGERMVELLKKIKPSVH
jgi:putative intracellular protease/amidase